MIKRISLIVCVAGTVVLGGLFAGGCGSDSGPDPQKEAMAVENAKNMRAYFDKAGGNYDSLNEVDKAAFVQLSGGEEKAKQNWDLMKYGPGAAARTDEAPTADGGSGNSR